jgi:Protein of unknown function (DUF2752)
MQLTRRHLGPTDLDHELVWLVVSFSSLTLAASWWVVGLPWPRCAFHDMTGLPCLTCGMTRSAIQFFHGHFLAALRWNPLVLAGLCGLSVFNIYALAVLVMRAPRIRIARLTCAEKFYARTAIVALLALNWIYVLAHWRNF